MYFASRFLTEFETKYSINELELLAVVWAIEHFKNYVYGTKFKVISDHKALSSVLRPNRGNKTFSSRLTRWVDRLLPFDFEVTHAPGRVLGFADYLSRHPSNLEGSTIQAEQLWNEWFTVNVISQFDAISVDEAKPMVDPKGKVLTRTRESVLKVESERRENAKQRQPIKSEHGQNKNETIKRSGAYNPSKGQVDSESIFTSISKINEAFLPANYEADKNLQKVINLVKTREGGGEISRLPSPWREKFNSLSVDQRNFLHMDNRLVIPSNLRAAIMSSLHYGNPGRDVMLRNVADIWWPKIHREVVNTAKYCEECSTAGKNGRVIQKQSDFGKIPESLEPNEEVALDFAGLFKNA